MRHRFKVLAAGISAVALIGALVGTAPTASAQTNPLQPLLDDAPVLLENLPAALEDLAEGLQEAADVAASTQSAVATSAAIGSALESAGGILVGGTANFSDLALGLFLLNLGVQQGLAAYLEALDDPATAAELFSAMDLDTIQAQLADAVDLILHGSGPGAPGLPGGIAHLLQGNVIEPPLGLGPSAYTGVVVNTILALFNATDGTNFVGIFQVLGITSLVVGGVLVGYETEIEDALEPVVDALAPISEVLIPVVLAL